MTAMDLDEAVVQLYALPVEGFLPRRAELAAAAKSAGNRGLAAEITALRKPTVSAWAVNLLSRTRPSDIARLADLATRLRAAQAALDAAQMTRLGRERTALVDELPLATLEVAGAQGASLSPAALRQVAATLVAALASPEAGAAVESGRLTRALEYAGFGEVDLRDATARPLHAVPDLPVEADAESAVPATPEGHAGPTRKGPAGPTPESVALQAAEAELRRAVAAATEATDRHGILVAQADLAQTRVTHLQRELAAAREQRDRTADALSEAEVALARTQQRTADARAAVEALRTVES